MGPAKAVMALLRGEDVLIDGVRYRIVDGRLHTVLSTRTFRSSLTVDALMAADIQPTTTETPSQPSSKDVTT